MMLNGILKGDYQELLDVIAYEIHLPTFARQKPPLPLLPSCGGGNKQIRRHNSLYEAGSVFWTAEDASSRLLSKVAATGQDSYDKK